MTVTVLSEIAPSSSELSVLATQIPAGFPSPALDYAEERVSLDQLMQLRAPHTFIASTQGRSLENIGIFDGDLLIVDRSRDPESGEVVVAAINGDPLAKIYVKTGDTVELRPANNAYPTITLQEGDELDIWGVVRWSVRKHDRHG